MGAADEFAESWPKSASAGGEVGEASPGASGLAGTTGGIDVGENVGSK
jgi:hypothetical protein